MARYAEVSTGIVTTIIIAEREDDKGPGSWLDVTEMTCAIGDTYDGGVFISPPVPKKTILTQQEFVEIWTADEWRQLKRAAAGDLSPSPVSENISARLDQLFDAIRLTDSFDVAGDTADQFFGYLVTQGFITQARADELQAGL